MRKDDFKQKCRTEKVSTLWGKPMIVVEYADQFLNGMNLGKPVYIPYCLTCRKPYAHWFDTTNFCGICELDHRADAFRHKATTKADKDNKR